MSISRLPRAEQHQLGAPRKNRRLGTIPARLLGRIGFAAVAACFAPHEKSDVCRSGVAQGHWRTIYDNLLEGSDRAHPASLPLWVRDERVTLAVLRAGHVATVHADLPAAVNAGCEEKFDLAA
jgi:hypothetical protein